MEERTMARPKVKRSAIQCHVGPHGYTIHIVLIR